MPTEGIELYPAESRLVDTSNQYHLWVFKGRRLATGFQFRAVADGKPPFLPDHQPPFEDDRPSDCVDLRECKSWRDVAHLLPHLFQRRGNGFDDALTLSLVVNVGKQISLTCGQKNEQKPHDWHSKELLRQINFAQFNTIVCFKPISNA